MNIKDNIKTAKGEIKPDLVVSGDVLSVFSGEVFKADVAIKDGFIVGVGDYHSDKTYETDGVIIPGLIDAHMHVESSFLKPVEFSRAVIPHGTTSVIADPHEIANVAGSEGVKYLSMLSENSLTDFYFMAPSCVPSNRQLETYGGEINHQDIREMLSWDNVIGLGELMDFEGVLNQNPDIISKLEVASGSKIDGHSPGLTGNRLNAYLVSGADTDHENITPEEVEEKVRKGMKIILREGSASRDLTRLVGSVTQKNHSQFMLGTDDLDPTDIQERGHMDHRIKLSNENGVPPEIAVKMATINTAQHYNLDIGAIAPGYKADIVVVDSLRNMNTEAVFKDGKLIWKDGFKVNINSTEKIETKSYVEIPEINPTDLEAPPEGEEARIIDIKPNKIITEQSIAKVGEKGLPDPERDIARAAVIDRHGKGKHIGLGFVRGFGIEKGALASTVGHDSHNLISIGFETKEMVRAINKVRENDGGLVVSVDGETTSLPLPIAGLISDLTYQAVAEKLQQVRKEADRLGIKIEHPFMKMSFLSLPVIPEIRLTDYGLVDVNENKFTNLWIE
ncbi:MAG: adenine deaminase [Methanonatronarchaeia archaeon]|nr:MAG: adenine deaminase [Methanonatronarchaeia archaeon]